MRKADIFNFGKLAGCLVEDDDGRYTFTYNADYLSDTASSPISQTMPLGQAIYTSDSLMPFFDGLIPEGWLLDIASETWKLNPNDRMGLLLACCRDAIGSVSVREALQ